MCLCVCVSVCCAVVDRCVCVCVCVCVSAYVCVGCVWGWRNPSLRVHADVGGGMPAFHVFALELSYDATFIHLFSI